MRTIYKILFSVCFLLLVNIKSEAVSVSFPLPSPSDTYKKETILVHLPARINGTIWGHIGMLAALPYVIVSEDFYTPYEAAGSLGYHLVGYPLFLLKKYVWDFPCYLYNSMFGDAEPDKIPEAKKKEEEKPPPKQ